MRAVISMLTLAAGLVAMMPSPAEAVVYCTSAAVPRGCVARPLAAAPRAAARRAVTPGVGAPGVGVAPRVGGANLGGPVNRVGPR